MLQRNAVRSNWDSGCEAPHILEFRGRLEVSGQIHASADSSSKKLLV
jgi:hypothetical protein